MTRSSRRSRFERIAAFTTGLLLSAVPLHAQEVVQPLPGTGAAERLSDSLRVLASNSGDVLALIAAGEAALDLDDADTAYGFFARADVIAPTDPHVKAGLGRTLVRLERADEALAQFARARALGLDSPDMASDRGLAHDLRGDFVAAQTDYQEAIRLGGGDEAVRRLALSQAIGGDARTALTTLAPLIARNDAPSWRARAFILAMDGDAPGARGIAQARMSPGMAGLFERFFARLPSLNPAERARAVHFGDMPAEGVRYASARAVGGGAGTQVASGSPPPRGTVRARGGALIPQGTALGRRSPSTRSRDTRRQAARPASGRRTVVAAAPPPSSPPPPLPAPFRVTLPAPPPPPEPTPYRVVLPMPAPAPPPVQIASASPASLSADRTVTVGPERDASPTQPSIAPAVAPAAIIPSVASAGTIEATSPAVSTTGDADLPPATRPQAGAVATVDPDLALRPGDTVVTPQGATLVPPPTPTASPSPILSVPLSGVRGPDGPASLLPPGALPPTPSLAEAVQTPRPGFQSGSAAATAPPPSPPPPPAPKPAAVKPKPPAATPPQKLAAAEPKKAAADPKDKPAAKAAKPDPKAKSDPKTKPDPKAKPDLKAKAKPKALPVAERYWYQVATGTSVQALAADLARMKKKYDLLAKLDGVTSEFGSKRRLVVGPFKTLAEAKAFGVKARTAGLDGYVWVSPEGFEVDALPGK